jgi:hypothetical protein
MAVPREATGPRAPRPVVQFDWPGGRNGDVKRWPCDAHDLRRANAAAAFSMFAVCAEDGPRNILTFRPFGLFPTGTTDAVGSSRGLLLSAVALRHLHRAVSPCDALFLRGRTSAARRHALLAFDHDFRALGLTVLAEAQSSGSVRGPGVGEILGLYSGLNSLPRHENVAHIPVGPLSVKGAHTAGPCEPTEPQYVKLNPSLPEEAVNRSAFPDSKKDRS